jgi:hypothetical protein
MHNFRVELDELRVVVDPDVPVFKEEIRTLLSALTDKEGSG